MDRHGWWRGGVGGGGQRLKKSPKGSKLHQARNSKVTLNIKCYSLFSIRYFLGLWYHKIMQASVVKVETRY